MSHPNLETARLLLRPVTPEDDRAVFRWCGDPKVNKFMIYRKAIPESRLWHGNAENHHRLSKGAVRLLHG